MRARVCVADGTAVFRGAVRQVLSREKDFDVLEASTLAELEHALDLGIDIALIDDELPPEGALPAVRAASGRCEQVIVWTLRPDPDRILDTIRAGANGYLRKEISAAGLVRSIRGTSQGESPLSRDLSALMIEALHRADNAAQARDLAGSLSSRERQVLDLVARGSRNKQIAVELTISEFTVKRHVQNILTKLELPSRRAAAAFHRSLGSAAGLGEEISAS